MLLYFFSLTALITSNLIHEVIPVGPIQCNCSILGDKLTREAIVVDPGDDVDRILEILRKHDLKVRAIMSTHAHIDHVGGLALLHKATGAPVLIHQGDLDLYRNLHIQAEWMGVPTPPLTNIKDFVKEADSLRWGGFAARVLHTPGHTPGSISLVVEEDAAKSVEGGGMVIEPPKRTILQPRLLAGDTLFRGSIGRTDLWGGSHPQILESIREKLFVLPDENGCLFRPRWANSDRICRRENNPFFT